MTSLPYERIFFVVLTSSWMSRTVIDGRHLFRHLGLEKNAQNLKRKFALFCLQKGYHEEFVNKTFNDPNAFKSKF